jgi:3',5'-cyclic AMP phosphodiesterase CpdA
MGLAAFRWGSSVLIIAQLSDFHVRPPGETAYGVDTNAMFAEAVDAVLRLRPRPDLVLVSGDLADCGLDAEYALVARGLAALPMPVFVIPGNHDRRETLVRGLAGHGYLPASGFINYAVEEFPLRLIGLDSVLPGEGHGGFCAERRKWLAETLARGGGRPTLVMIHHAPFRVGVDGMDELMLRDADGLEAIIRRHPEVERVVCGHYHRPITVRYAGTVGFCAPSTAHQVAFDLNPGQTNRFIMEPPGLAVHTWQPSTGIATHVVPIGDYGAPFDVVLEAEYPGRIAHA